MIRINLLPTEEVERAADQRQQIAAVGLVVAVGVLAWSSSHTVAGGADGARQPSPDAGPSKELEAIQGPYAELVKLRRSRRSSRRSSRSSPQLEAKKRRAGAGLADLASATPEKLWLTEFDETGGHGQDHRLGVDEQTIADFLRRLGSSTYFTSVDLDETSQVTQENVKQKKFTLKAAGELRRRTRRRLHPRARRAPAARQDGGREAGVADHDRLGNGGDAMMSGLLETISELADRAEDRGAHRRRARRRPARLHLHPEPEARRAGADADEHRERQATLEQKRVKVNARAEEEKRIRDLQAE